MRKPISIGLSENQEGLHTYAVVCDDGTLFKCWDRNDGSITRWLHIPPVPQDDFESLDREPQE